MAAQTSRNGARSSRNLAGDAAAAADGGEVVAGIEPLTLGRAVIRAVGKSPALGREAATLAREQLRIAAGRSDVAPSKNDGRFADAAWTENPFYRRLGQSYIAWTEALSRLVEDSTVDWRTAERARFGQTLLTSALAPTNYFLGNPKAIKRAFDTGGLSVVRGTKNWLRDLRENRGMPAQVDRRPFQVGENMAVTPGAVVHRNELCEVIQYTPSTPEVFERPVLMIPPQINKYYFMDLAPGRSFVEYAVGRGIPFFTISWRNPGREHADVGIDEYLEACLDAVDVVCEVTGSDKVNVVALCAGGITTSLMLNAMAATGDDRVGSVAFAVTILDFETPSMIGMFASPGMVDRAKQRSARKGVFPGRDLAHVFSWLRPNDLVWNYWVNNYLRGEDPPAFDILAWNADATNLPAALHADFLDIFLGNGLRESGAVTALGHPVDLSTVTCDNYVVGGLTDHLTPWQACYRTTQLLSGPSTFVLAGSGHIQSLVNPPGIAKARLWVGGTPGPDPDAWLANAKLQVGQTWWVDWADWVTERAGATRSSRAKLGSKRYPPREAAPGTYILEPC